METRMLELKLRELEQRAKKSNTYCTDIRLELIQEMLDFIAIHKYTRPDEPPQYDYEHLKVCFEELGQLQKLRFDTFEEALKWAEENADTEISYDKDDGYIDFGLGRFDCSFVKSDDGSWKLTDITSVCDTDGNAILEIVG